MSNLSSQTTLLPAYLSLGANVTRNPYQTLIPSSTPNPFLPSPVPSLNFDLLSLSRPPAPTITEPQKTNHLQAIIKIGSNTGSITITDLVNKYYIESDKFNLGEGLSKEKDEKKFNLGEDLSEQQDKKKLKKDNIDYSLKTMERWAQIMKLYGITECEIVATESLRAASDGQEYLNQAIKILNDANPSMVINNRIIPAQEEAKLSIETVKSQLGPKIKDGYVVDYGGASCEISKVTGNELATGDNGKGVFSSLKIGAHPLIAELKKLNQEEELWGKDLSDLIRQLKPQITEELNTLNFINNQGDGKAAKENRETLYLIGGSLRKAGESIMEKGETLNDINLDRKTILGKLIKRQNSLLETIQANHERSEVKRLDHLKDLVSNLALISLLEKMPKKTEIKFIENGMVDALISREAKEQGLDLSILGPLRPFGPIATLDLEKGVKLGKWLTKWIQAILPEKELSDKEKSTINSAATYSYLYPTNTNTSEANRIKESLADMLDKKENKDQILNILIPSMTGKDSINILKNAESNLSKLTAQLLKLAKLISFNNPEILNYFELTKNPETNKISLENKSSTSPGIDQQDIHKLTNGGKVDQALGRINKIYNEITKKITQELTKYT
jgi:exopolyphosphatase/pppGpp-phosphohydrolase